MIAPSHRVRDGDRLQVRTVPRVGALWGEESGVSSVSTSIPKGAHALVEVSGRQNFKSLFAGKARRHNDTAYIPRRKEIIEWDVECVRRSPTIVRKDTVALLMSKVETATGTVTNFSTL